MESNTENIHHYYVDEAGCMTLFNNKGKSIIGNPGVSKVFMVGVAHVPKPDVAKEYLDVLRKDLLEDAYFKGVSSMQPSAKKTASCFHACKDVAEVRYHVFKLLPRLKVKVQIVIRRKRDLIELLKKQYHTFRRNEIENYVYDDLVKRIFRNLLHKADENKIVFARKGKSARTDALATAINKAKRNFEQKYNILSDRPTKIISSFPREFVGLQIIDYYLWALQRLYECGEDRFFNLLSDDYRLIVDLDDTKNYEYGEYYKESNPLTLKKIKPVAS